MEYYFHSVDMPFSGLKIVYKELTSKQFLALTKANLINPLSEDSVLDYCKFLQEIILECVKNKEDFSKLNLIDYFLFLAKLREVSVGEDLNLFLSKEDDIEVKFTLSAASFIERLYLGAKNSLPDEIISFNNINIQLDWPNYKNEELLIKPVSNSQILEKITNSMHLFIKSITLDNSKTINLEDLNLEEGKILYENLPYSLRQDIQNIILKAINGLKDYNIWNIKNVEGFISGIDVFDFKYQNIFRLFFNEDYNKAMEEYYVLASKNILPSYVDNLSLADKKMFVSFLIKEIESSKQSEEDNSFDNL